MEIFDNPHGEEHGNAVRLEPCRPPGVAAALDYLALTTFGSFTTRPPSPSSA